MLELVEIEWLDHCTMEGWCDVRDACAIANPKLRTVGYLLYEDEDRYVVSNSKSIDESHEGERQIFNSLFAILKGTVVSVKYVGSDTVCSGPQIRAGEGVRDSR